MTLARFLQTHLVIFIFEALPMNMLALNTPDQDYWTNFYSDSKFSKEFHIPSQFSAFCLSEMRASEIKRVIEIGCGNGRDTFLFLQHGLSVTATDKSEAAVTSVQEKFGSHKNLRTLTFDVASVDSIACEDHEKPLAIYARFVLHALTNEQIKSFFNFCSGSTREGDKVFVEYRTSHDKDRHKEFSGHFRNFLDPSQIEALSQQYKFSLCYETIGTGLAKFRDDDAHVARQVFTKES